MTILTRLLAVCVAVLATWFGLGVAATAATEPALSPVAFDTYGHPHHAAALAHTTTVRGPPAAQDPGATYDAVDRGPRGTSARPNGPTTRSTSSNTTPSTPVEGIGTTTTTGAQVVLVTEDLSSLVRGGVAANAGARMADVLLGVPRAPMSRALARLQGLRLGDKSIVQGVDAFGSRAGSTFRGRGPTAGSDLDLLVRIDPTALGGRSGPWIQRTLRSIADDFEAEAGFPLSIHAPGNIGMFEKSIPGATFVPLG